jgi:hypothetical protein
VTPAIHIPVSFAVEGPTDEAVVRRMAEHVAVDVHQILGRRGKHWVLARLHGLNRSARRQPWYVLVDLDMDAHCAGEFVRRHLPHPSPSMCFRVAVRSIEAWLLSDRAGFARFFGVRQAAPPAAPESEPNPKTTVLDLARRSSKTLVLGGVPPRPGSGRRTGDLYASLLIEFATRHWDLEVARGNSKSLDRALQRLAGLIESS